MAVAVNIMRVMRKRCGVLRMAAFLMMVMTARAVKAWLAVQKSGRIFFLFDSN